MSLQVADNHLDRLAPGVVDSGLFELNEYWQAWPIQMARRGVYGVTSALILRPMAYLYLHGPAGLGFWAGADFPAICSRLTNTPAQFWESSSEAAHECVAVVRRHFESGTVLAGAVAYIGVLCALVHRWCIRAPARPIIVMHPPPQKV